ncbi:MAG: DUF4230 domain-containing protein [Bacteroidales bacterium]|nr:DUF4230 domain-containing protein [Bacteroidales bacterium]
MRKKLLFLLPLLVLIISCGPSKDELLRQRIQGIQKIAELGTVEYTVKKIVKNENTKAWYKYGERKILFSTTSYIKAGIDLKEFSDDDLERNNEGEIISVTLPKAKVLSFNMPPECIKEAFTKVTGLRDKITPEEKQELLALAEENILKDSTFTTGILEDAQKNAKLFFTALFTQFGYENIDIKFE